MKERLERMPGPGADDIWAMTFHSACARILRRDIDRLGYDKSFTIYDSADSVSLMRRILKDLNIEERDFPPRSVLGTISRAKDEMIFADEFIASAGKTYEMRRRIIGRAYKEYENRLRASNALDFDDLLLLTIQLFWDNPDIQEHYRNRFRYVLIDEYQDTNNLQYLLAVALAGGHGNICVVGDDDQSIYKFRGATIENILSFENRFRDARVIRLEQNYRSTSFILDAANDVIRNNKGRKGKKLWTKNIPGEKPSHHVVSDERDEARFVADMLISSRAGGRNWNEHAILYRMNAQSNQFETAFKRNGIPYRVFGGTGFFERAEIKDMLAYLCLIHNPSDDVRLLRVINTPPRGIGDTTIARLAAFAAQSGLPMFGAIRVAKEDESLKSAAGRLNEFANMIDGLREFSLTRPLDELYDALINRTGYIRVLEEKNSNENIARIENVRELKTNIISFMNDNGGSLFDFLNETALYTDLDRDDHDADRVFLMTMHSAKGLEFDTVFIVGAEEGVFPGNRSIGEPEEMEEERRLCYVAMTRAMRRLYFTSAQQRMLFGKTTSNNSSRFIREISAENIDVHEPFYSRRGTDFNYAGGFGRHSGEGYGRSPAADYKFEAPDTPAHDSPAPRTHRPPARNTARQAQDSPADYKKGDMVMHKSFGCGTIISLSPGGGDVLLEIAFEESGTKRMLLNSAAKYLNKA